VVGLTATKHPGLLISNNTHQATYFNFLAFSYVDLGVILTIRRITNPVCLVNKSGIDPILLLFLDESRSSSPWSLLELLEHAVLCLSVMVNSTFGFVQLRINFS
jgi:hypothetical protein